jgi:hypothetical protein
MDIGEKSSRVEQGQTRLKLSLDRIDIIYSGRGMPFRCRNIITLLRGDVGVGE